jgi:hypothetical protein
MNQGTVGLLQSNVVIMTSGHGDMPRVRRSLTAAWSRSKGCNLRCPGRMCVNDSRLASGTAAGLRRTPIAEELRSLFRGICCGEVLSDWASSKADGKNPRGGQSPSKPCRRHRLAAKSAPGENSLTCLRLRRREPRRSPS